MEDKISKSISEKKIVEVPLTSISNIDINPRKGGLVMENVEALVLSGDFPEIHLGLLDGDLIVVDGYHRLAATQRLERESINAFIIEYNDIDEIKKQAFILNVNHGIKLSQLDIALNIYDFYISAMKKETTSTLSSIIKEHHLQERTGRYLFYWALFNRGVLENSSVDLTNLTKYEDYVKLLKWKGENNLADISEEFKMFFKEFYSKYDSLPTTNRRAAIDYVMDGKEFFEEFEKEKQAVEDMKAVDKETKSLSTDNIGDDAVDRNGINAGAGVGAVTSGTNPNQAIEEIGGDSDGIVDLNPSKTKEKKKETASNLISDMHEKAAMIKLNIIKGNLVLSKNDYEALQSIMDNLSEAVEHVDSSKFYGNSI